MIDEKSTFLHLPLPHIENPLDGDVERLRQSLVTLDGNAEAQNVRLDKQDSTQEAQAATLAAQGQTITQQGEVLGEHTESLATQAQSLAQQQNALLGHDAEIDAVQQAILSVITGAGMAQDGANNAQLLAAIQQLISLKTALATVQKAGLVKPDGITIKIDATGEIYSSSTFLAGGIVMFSGTFGGSDGKRPIPLGTSAAEEGWALCDGSNGTPDLRGRFILGASEDYAQDSTGGAASAEVSGTTGGTTLTVECIPSHTHSLPNNVDVTGSNTWKNVWTHENVYLSSNLMKTYATGGSQAHSHSMGGTVSTLPPYYALAYIMKVAAA
ncbi:MAG: hypothetical protein PHN64_04660 [Desulfovibrionaceae bacterium]|nr:hypothetical protein [Desulfovibrionaceae bacterium]